GHDLQIAELGGRVRPVVRLDEAHHHVGTARLAAAPLVQHGERLAHPRRHAEIDAQPPALRRLVGLELAQRLDRRGPQRLRRGRLGRRRLLLCFHRCLVRASRHTASRCSYRARSSSARFSRSTFTRGSPSTNSVRPSVYWSTSCCTCGAGSPRAAATRATWSAAFAGVMCGSSPLAEAVTASTGTGTLSARPFSSR